MQAVFTRNANADASARVTTHACAFGADFPDAMFTPDNLLPRIFSAFNMAAWRRPWQTADHVSHELANHKARYQFKTIKLSNVFGDK